MQPGRVLLRPAPPRFRGASRGPGVFRYAMLWLDPELIARSTGGMLDASTDMPHLVELAQPAIVGAMAAMATQVETPGPGGRLPAQSLATTILIELVRHKLVGGP